MTVFYFVDGTTLRIKNNECKVDYAGNKYMVWDRITNQLKYEIPVGQILLIEYQ